MPLFCKPASWRWRLSPIRSCFYLFYARLLISFVSSMSQKIKSQLTRSALCHVVSYFLRRFFFCKAELLSPSAPSCSTNGIIRFVNFFSLLFYLLMIMAKSWQLLIQVHFVRFNKSSSPHWLIKQLDYRYRFWLLIWSWSKIVPGAVSFVCDVSCCLTVRQQLKVISAWML